MTAADRRIIREAGPFDVTWQFCGNSKYIFTVYHRSRVEPRWWVGTPAVANERKLAIERLLNAAARPEKKRRKR